MFKNSFPVKIWFLKQSQLLGYIQNLGIAKTQRVTSYLHGCD